MNAIKDLWDNSIHTETWDCHPSPGTCFTEHKLYFVDSIIRASHKVYVRNPNSPPPEDIFVSNPLSGAKDSILDILDCLPGYKFSAFGPGCNVALPKSTPYFAFPRTGTLNGRWGIYLDTEGIIPPAHCLVAGPGGSAIIRVVDSSKVQMSSSVDPSRYPHKCPHCAGKAYIGGMNQVECSNHSCKSWDKKDDFAFEIGEVSEEAFTIHPTSISKRKDPVGNPHYQQPNPGQDTTDPDFAPDLDIRSHSV